MSMQNSQHSTMFSSSLLNTAAACSSPIIHYYHHLQQHDHLQEFLFQHHNPVLHQDATDDHVPIGYTTTPSFDKSKAINMMPEESAEGAPKKKKKSNNKSKIRTAQGLRDRRVRMSIGIAQKFFDLQDLLGFDKPSRTLEWLFTNSNKAILELSAAASSFSASSDHESPVVERHGDGYKSLSMHSLNQAVQLPCNAAFKSTMKQKAAFLARESRDKARARARARTVAKLSTANFNHQKNRLLNDPEDMMISGDHWSSYLSGNDQDHWDHKQEKRKIGEDEQPKQNQQLQLQNCDSVIESYHWSSGLNPNLSLDHWDVNCVYPQQGSSAAHRLNLSRDFDINGRAIWDNLHNNYRTL